MGGVRNEEDEFVEKTKIGNKNEAMRVLTEKKNRTYIHVIACHLLLTE